MVSSETEQQMLQAAYEEFFSVMPLDDCPRRTPSRTFTCGACLLEAYFDLGQPAGEFRCERRHFMHIARNQPTRG